MAEQVLGQESDSGGRKDRRDSRKRSRDRSRDRDRENGDRHRSDRSRDDQRGGSRWQRRSSRSRDKRSRDRSRDRDRDEKAKRDRSQEKKRDRSRSRKRSRGDSRHRSSRDDAHSKRRRSPSAHRPSDNAPLPESTDEAAAVAAVADARKSGFDIGGSDPNLQAELARGSEEAAKAAERSRRRRSGWDSVAPDPNEAPKPAAPQEYKATGSIENSSINTKGSITNDELFLANYGLPVVAIKIKENCVARIIGRGGETIKMVEQQTGATVKLDRSSKAAGISLCRIYGASSAAQKAADMIRLKVAAVYPVAQEDLPEGFFTEEFKVEPRLIGLILGRGGEGLRKIQDESGASVCFFKDEEHLDKLGRPKGDSFHIVGRPENITKAKQMFYSRLEVEYICTYGAEGLDLTKKENIYRPGDVVKELQVQQPYVGRIIGKGKGAIKPITDQTGCRVQLDQTTKEHGYSIVRIIGPEDQATIAFDMLAKSIERANKGASDVAGDWACPKCGDIQFARNRSCRNCGTEQPPDVAAANAARDKVADDEIQVQQEYVGYLIGPGGQTLKQIKDQSGAKVFVDQDTKDKGYSIVRIGNPGTPENWMARDIIFKRIDECKNLPSNRLKDGSTSQNQFALNPIVTGKGAVGPDQQTVPKQLPNQAFQTPVIQGPATVCPPPPPQQGWSAPPQQWSAGQTSPGPQQWGAGPSSPSQPQQSWSAGPPGAPPALAPPPPPPPPHVQDLRQHQQQLSPPVKLPMPAYRRTAGGFIVGKVPFRKQA